MRHNGIAKKEAREDSPIFSRNPDAPFLLKPGAWFIADAHYASYQPRLYDFLASVKESDLPSQLVLMGDIFDLLFGDAPNSIEPNRKMVDLLKRISLRTEILYLEGNHDFGLKRIFADAIRIVERQKQPLILSVEGRTVALHHGDILQGLGYEIYTAWIRHPWVNRALNLIDTLTGGKIIGWLEDYNRKKKPCYRIGDFEKRTRKRLETLQKRYRFDIWIDGHFHQNVRLNYGDIDYINLPAFACDGSYTIMKTDAEGLAFEKVKDRNGI
ncbi:UDP-2,3-diacylglucosamine diphosphatase [Hydrogenimonas urashimensis]|uniref:UDP-2,3-diacylglucosamine diphosphatase n=1 Tax=Hydrogenimonas urashimensis TaxID=2740515 RepID=UPI001915C0C0|nr:metallophosphoesterase [Hydrogenimonas urashimensis]